MPSVGLTVHLQIITTYIYVNIHVLACTHTHTSR